MINLKLESGSSTGVMEFTSPTVQHPVQTTGSVTYNITHNFGIDGGPDFIKPYVQGNSGDCWFELQNYVALGNIYGYYTGQQSPASSTNVSRIYIARIGPSVVDVQFRCYKFSSDVRAAKA